MSTAKEQLKAGDSGKTAVQAFLDTAKRRFQLCAEAESGNRREALIDLQFLNLDQWPDGVKADRSQNGRERPCLTIDQINEPKRQIVNRVRQSTPGLMVRPVGGGADEVTAEIFEGLLRHIGSSERAKTARVMGFESSVSIGWGYYRILTEYESETSFDQDIVIAAIDNPMTVYPDPSPSTLEPEKRRFYFIVQDLTLEEYAEQYPDSELAGIPDFRSLGDDSPDWFPSGGVRIAEYWYVESTDDTLYQLSTGDTLWEADAKRMIADLEAAAATPAGAPIQVPTIVGQRKQSRPAVKWAKINAIEVLEGNEKKTGGRLWPGRYIPIVPVFGEMLNVDGVRVLRGIVRAARDPQRMYNYQNSALVETLALAPKAPWVGAEGQFEDHEQEWSVANTRNLPYLEYKPVALGGLLAPPPQRQVHEPAIQAIVLSIQQSRSDIRTTTQFYDASDPSIANSEQSGKAINARMSQSQSGSVNYVDNLARAMHYEAQILLDLAPRIYDRPGRVVRVLGMEDTVKQVMLKKAHTQGPDGQPQEVAEADALSVAEDGFAQFYDLDAGRYDVKVTIGASYATKRQESFEMMSRLVEAQPALMPIIGDLIMKNSDMPGHQEIADRLKKMLPPQLQEDEGDAGNIPPKLKAQIAQMQQQVQQMGQQLQQASEIIKTKQVEGQSAIEQARMKAEADMAKAELDSRTKIQMAELQAKVDLMQTEATLNVKKGESFITTELEHLKLALSALETRLEHERAEAQRGQDAEMAAQQQAQAQAEAEAPPVE